jgi:hypothetical protein
VGGGGGGGGGGWGGGSGNGQTSPRSPNSTLPLTKMPGGLPHELFNLLVIFAAGIFIAWLVRICKLATRLSDLRLATMHNHVVQLQGVGPRCAWPNSSCPLRYE